VSGEEWRVEVELGDERRGESLGERLRGLDLDDDVRKRLGRRVVVTRSGSKLYLYTNSEAEAGEAERVVRELLSADEAPPPIATSRWHPVEEDWKDASLPLPRDEGEAAVERERRDERERREAEAEGEYDWSVHAHAPARDEAQELERTLQEDGFTVERRWRYLTIGALNEEQANEIAARVREELPEAEVDVEPNVDLPPPLFVWLRSLL
jgi:hypothetical protein